MRDHEYFVYIMSSHCGTLYIGMTNSIYRRALQHKSGEIEGFTSRYHCNGWFTTKASTTFTEPLEERSN